MISPHVLLYFRTISGFNQTRSGMVLGWLMSLILFVFIKLQKLQFFGKCTYLCVRKIVQSKGQITELLLCLGIVQ